VLLQEFVCQPDVEYRELIRRAAAFADFDRVDAAFAYATTGGVQLLVEALETHLNRWDRVKKRWLIGLDWCRTEPAALDLLEAQSRSSVGTADGAFVVERAGCTPRLPWHPKTLILRGPSAIAVLAGSGNLSRNGLTRGHEVGGLVVVRAPGNAAERSARARCVAVADWFEAQWRRRTALSVVASQYASRFRAEARSIPPVTDEDTQPTHQRRGWTPERLRKLRTSDNLWIEAGNLHKNRGAGQPGNQLMMSPMTRVFFGFPAEDLPTDSAVGSIAIRYGNYTRWDSSLRFSNNAMDVLGLPVPGAGGPAAYDQETLCLRQTQDAGRIIFEMQLGTSAQKRAWRRQSRAIDGDFAMSSGRRWGVF
jgi:hypothetical protein